jgi:hypothetical protein
MFKINILLPSDFNFLTHEKNHQYFSHSACFFLHQAPGTDPDRRGIPEQLIPGV